MKGRNIIINLILIIWAIAVIPLNLYLFNIPRWIGVVCMMAIVSACILLWADKKRLIVNIVMTIANVLALIIVFVGVYCNPYWNSISFRTNVDYYCVDYDEVITYEEAVHDLNCAMQHLADAHPLFISGLSDDMEALYVTARGNLNNYDSISVNILCKEIQQIFSSIGDGHTHIYANFPEFHYLKHRYHHNMAGDVLVAINGVSIKDLFEKKKALFSYETEAYGMNHLKSYLSMAEDLDYLGISLENSVTYIYETTEEIKF